MNKRNYFYIVVIVLIGCFAGLFVYHNHEEKGIDYLIRKIKSEAPEVRDDGVAEIAKYHNKAIKPLSVLLLDNNQDIRKSAIEAFGNIKSAESATTLIAFHQRAPKSQALSWEVQGALLNIGKPAAPAMIQAFDSSEVSTKLLILNTFNVMLGNILGTDTADDIKKLYIKTLLSDNSRQARMFALVFLNTFRYTKDNQDVNKVLKDALNDKDIMIREEAARILSPGSREK